MLTISALRAYATGDIDTLSETAYESYRRVNDAFSNMSISESFDKAAYMMLEESCNMQGTVLTAYTQPTGEIITEGVIGSIVNGFISFIAKIIEILKAIISKIVAFIGDLFGGGGSSDSSSSSRSSSGSSSSSSSSSSGSSSRSSTPSAPSTPPVPPIRTPTPPRSNPIPSSPSRPSAPTPPPEPPKPKEVPIIVELSKWDLHKMRQFPFNLKYAAEDVFKDGGNNIPEVWHILRPNIIMDYIKSQAHEAHEMTGKDENDNPYSSTNMSIAFEGVDRNLMKDMRGSDEYEVTKIYNKYMRKIFDIDNSRKGRSFDGNEMNWYNVDDCFSYAKHVIQLDYPKDTELTKAILKEITEFSDKRTSGNLIKAVKDAVILEKEYFEKVRKEALNMKGLDHSIPKEDILKLFDSEYERKASMYAKLGLDEDKLVRDFNTLYNRLVTKAINETTRIIDHSIKFFNKMDQFAVNFIGGAVKEFRKAILVYQKCMRDKSVNYVLK